MAFGDVVGTVKTATTSGATSLTATLDATPADGNLIVVAHFTGDSDSQARSPMAESVAATDGTQSDQAAIYHRFVQSGDSATQGANSAGSDQAAIVLVQLEGPFEASPLDKTATDAVTTGTPLASKTSGTTAATAQAVEVAIGAVSLRNTGGATDTLDVTAWSNGFTQVGEAYDLNGTASAKGVAMARKTLAATGAQETTASLTSRSSMGLIVTFMAAGGVAAPHRAYRTAMERLRGRGRRPAQYQGIS